MRRQYVLITVWGLLFAGSLLLRNAVRDRRPEPVGLDAAIPSTGCRGAVGRRIVSLAPSITEILFALGLDDRVAGVTRFCHYPPAASGKPRIGGYSDPSYESIMALRADLVVALPEHEDVVRRLAPLEVKTLVVNHRDIDGILDSITSIGAFCGTERRAAEIVSGLRTRLERVRGRVAGLARPRVLICIGRNMGSGGLKDVYISGDSGFFGEMIGLAGGQNAYDGGIAFPAVSAESLIRMDPEVIVDMIPGLGSRGWDESLIKNHWGVHPGIAAVRTGRVHVFGEDFVVIPGPRFILILERLARVIHPEIDWESDE